VPQLLQISEGTAALRRLFFQAVDATDGISPETGLTGVGRITKNGATSAASSGSLTEIDSTNMPGRYYIELTAAELDTNGIIEFRYKAAACAEVVARGQVVPWDPYDAVRQGMTALPAVVVEGAGGLYTRGSGAGQINQSNDGQIDSNIERWLNNVVQAAEAGKPNVNVIQIDGFTVAGQVLGAWINSGVRGTAQSGTTTTMVDTARTEADDVKNGSWIIFTGGALKGQGRLVTDFDSASDTTTFAPALTTGVGTETYVIIPIGGVDIQSWLGLATALVAPNALVSGAVDSRVSAMLTAVINLIRDAILPPINIALNDIPFLMVDGTDFATPETGLTPTATRSLDGGTTFVATTGTVTEAANGIYHFDASAADMNGKSIIFKFSDTGAADAFVVIRTGG